MQNNKIGFFEQFKISVFRPGEYFKLSNIKTGRLTAFIFLLVFVSSFFSIAIPLFTTFFGPNNPIDMVYENAHDFQIQDGEFYISSPYEHTDDTSNTYILLDSNIESFNTSDIDTSYNDVIMVSRTNAVMYSNNDVNKIEFDSINFIDFNKEDLIKLKSLYIIFILLIFFIAYLFQVGWYYLSSLLYSIYGNVFSNFRKTELSFSSIFRVSAYSKVTIKILYTIFALINLNPPSNLKNIVAILITCFYITTAIISYKPLDELEDTLSGL